MEAGEPDSSEPSRGHARRAGRWTGRVHAWGTIGLPVRVVDDQTVLRARPTRGHLLAVDPLGLLGGELDGLHAAVGLHPRLLERLAGLGGDFRQHRIGIFEIIRFGIFRFLAGRRVAVGALFGAGTVRRPFALRIGGRPIGLTFGGLSFVLDTAIGRLFIHKLDRVEVARNRRLCFLIGCIDEPHDQKERHQCCHEVGIGDLPDTAVMPFFLAMPAPSDDNDFPLDFRPIAVSAHATASFKASDQSASRVAKTVPSKFTIMSMSSLSSKAKATPASSKWRASCS